MTNIGIVFKSTTGNKIDLSIGKWGRKKGGKTFLGVVKWKIRDRNGFTGSKNHEMGVSGLAYRDDSIGDSWGYAHTLLPHSPAICLKIELLSLGAVAMISMERE